MLRRMIETCFGLPTLSVYSEGDTPFCGGVRSFRKYPEDKGDDLPVTFVKTHERSHAQTSSKTIYLIRDGRDAICSYAHYLDWTDIADSSYTFNDKRYPREHILRYCITGGFRSLPKLTVWSDHVRDWYSRADTCILHYEDIITRSAHDVLMQVCDALDLFDCGLKFTGKEPATFEQLNQQNPNFYRRGCPGGWRHDFTDELHELFWEHHGDMMRQCGYAMQPELV